MREIFLLQTQDWFPFGVVFLWVGSFSTLVQLFMGLGGETVKETPPMVQSHLMHVNHGMTPWVLLVQGDCTRISKSTHNNVFLMDVPIHCDIEWDIYDYALWGLHDSSVFNSYDFHHEQGLLVSKVLTWVAVSWTGQEVRYVVQLDPTSNFTTSPPSVLDCAERLLEIGFEEIESRLLPCAFGPVPTCCNNVRRGAELGLCLKER